METKQFESVRDYNARNLGKAWQIVAGWLDPVDFDPETRLWCAECLGDHDLEFSRVVFASDNRIYGQTCDYCEATIWEPEHRHGFAFTGTHADCDCGYTFKEAIDELNGVRNG